MRRTLILTPKNCAEKILLQTIFARILTLSTSYDTTFAPTSPLQPYSTSPSPRPSLALFLLLLHQSIHTKIRATRIVLKLLRSVQKQNLQAFLLKLRGLCSKLVGKPAQNWSIKEFCADGKQARNFCSGNVFPAQTKFYSLGRPGTNAL